MGLFMVRDMDSSRGNRMTDTKRHERTGSEAAKRTKYFQCEICHVIQFQQSDGRCKFCFYEALIPFIPYDERNRP